MGVVESTFLLEGGHGWVEHLGFLGSDSVHVEESEALLVDAAVAPLESLVGDSCLFLEQLVEGFLVIF
jgi:hypothetical protein